MMYWRIMLACSLWEAWPVPSSAKYRRAVNCASMRFIRNEFDGVQAISALLAAAQAPARRSRAVDRRGLKLSQTIAIRVVIGYRERR
jgi:hypothetical protein